MISLQTVVSLSPYNVDPKWSYFARRVLIPLYALSLWRELTRNSFNRTLLKSDQWISETHDTVQGLRGASNFRNIAGTSIYALGQPTIDAIDEVVRRIKEDYSNVDHIAWITLREEPVVYINGTPFCLRREAFTLRNMKGRSLIDSV